MSERVRTRGHGNTVNRVSGHSVDFPRPRLAVSDAAQQAWNVTGIDTALEEAFITRKLALLTLRQSQLDAALGRSYDRDDNLYRSFSVAKHVVALELAEDEEQRERVMLGMQRDIKTNLIERVKADTVPLKYTIINGQLYPDLSETDSPKKQEKRSVHESVRVMIETGVADRLSHGTLEADREQAELDGWNKLEAIMVNPETPIGTTLTIFSPQSTISEEGKKGAYDKKFVNEFTLLQDQEGNRYVELIQTDSDLTKQGFRDAASSLDRQFWDEYDNWKTYHPGEKRPPFDAYILSRPVKGSLPKETKEGKRMRLEAFEDTIYDNQVIQGMVDLYLKRVGEAVDRLSAQGKRGEAGILFSQRRSVIDTSTIDWKSLCIGLNAILNGTDALVELAGKDKGEAQSVHQIYPDAPKPELVSGWFTYQTSQEPVNELFIYQMVQDIGQKTPKAVGGMGCPTNKGYDVGEGSMASLSGPYKGSVANVPSGESCPKIRCGGEGCSWEASDSEAAAVQAGSLTACPRCGWKP